MGSEILFWNPYTSDYEAEKIYGEKWLRFSYQNFLGRIGLWGMVQRKWFSQWYGKRMDSPQSREKILPFINKYNLNQKEFLEAPETFKTFNEFFYRKLNREARPIDENDQIVIFPADGRHLIVPNLSEIEQIYAKGQAFNLRQLLGCAKLAKKFQTGAMLISRLCPVDYHRFHFPIDGKLTFPRLINGSLFSVNPIAVRQRISIFWENKRYISCIENQRLGMIVQLLIGATCVGTVHFSNKKNLSVRKGDEHGYFSFGGSCVITLFPENKINFRKDLVEQSSLGYESYFRFGENLGHIND